MKIKLPRRPFMIFCAVLLCLCLGAGAVVHFSRQDPDARSHYMIDAEYDPQTQTVRAHMVLNYVNRSGAALPSLCFHLYPAAYASEETAPFLPEDRQAFYPAGFSAGGIETEDITFNGRDVPVHYEGTGDQLLVLDHPLGKGQRAKVEMDFSLTLPESASRFGFCDNLVSLGNWYPIMSVYENGAWRNEEYTAIGDPFYSEMSDYTVRLTLPEEWVPAMSGKSVCTPLESGRAVWECSQSNIRDFACVLGPFHCLQKNVGGTEVRVFSLDENGFGEQALDYACAALELYNRLLGEYPYPTYQVAAAPLIQGGMEYPCLAMINASYFTAGGLHRLEYTIVHETAHQWWYGIVGNDEVNDAWIDEGLATYSSMLYYEQTKPEATAQAYFKYYVTNAFRFARADILRESPETSMLLSRPLSSFGSNTEYEMLCYQKSALMLQSLREQMGDAAFMEGLRALVRQNRFGMLNQASFTAAFASQSALPVESVIDAWLNDRVILP